MTLALNISRTIPATRDRVFAAWTAPEQLKQWWGPRGFSVPSAQIDLREGGDYRLEMKSPDGNIIHLYGTYREVRAPERLVYTWQFDDSEVTLVTVEFHDRGDATEIVLTHERFHTEASRTSHANGWKDCFDRLTEQFS